MKILAPLFALGLALSTLSGCSGSSASDDANTADESAADALTSSQRNTLILHVRAAFEKASASDSTGLVGSKTIDSSKLKGDARKAYKGYEQTSKDVMINSGWPRAEIGTIDGYVVYFVSGDVSDTGTEMGFYDARGKLLALAYSGQGMQANAAGVDWQTDAPAP